VCACGWIRSGAGRCCLGGSREEEEEEEEGGVWPSEQERQLLLCMEAVSTSDVICGQHLEQWGRNDPLGTDAVLFFFFFFFFIPSARILQRADQSFNITKSSKF
jgi:hypothetical protein